MKRLLSSIICFAIIFSVNLRGNAVEFISASNAKSMLLMEASSGKVLYEKNSHQSLPPASVTKIMTMLLICEAIERGEITLDTEITASERAKSMGGSTIFLETNEVMTLNDLLKGIAVASANDACVAVAEHMCGSVESFVELMNKRAKELGMKDTNFINCNGLDADGHYTSAYDIASPMESYSISIFSDISPSIQAISHKTDINKTIIPTGITRFPFSSTS